MILKEIVQRKTTQPLPQLSGLPDFLVRIYAARGVETLEDIELNLAALASNRVFKGLEAAAGILYEAICSDQHILIVGDFDADGATSTALAVLGLKSMGAIKVDYLVPNRFDFGYGLTPEIVDVASAQKPDVIITVDNGISSIEGVERAREYGIKTVITDHHLPGERLPNADAIVNPNQPGCEFISKAAAGVGVTFYLLSSLRQKLRSENWFTQNNIEEPQLADFLDLVALGTVADLVPLDKNNRILVEQGLKRIRAGRCRPGIIALAQCADRQTHSLRSIDMGFIIGPRLNAAGRLDDMSLGIECLLADSADLALQLAQRLDALNRERRTIEQEMRSDAEAILSTLFDEKNEGEVDLPWGLCLYEPHWHQGVIGILASRIKEKLHRPVIVFAPSGDDPEAVTELKGSARSIPGLHIRDALDKLAKQYPHLLQKFGGHAMAAGMTIKREHFESFNSAFNEVVRNTISENDLKAVMLSDGELNPEALNLETANLLRQAGPWGQNFAEPQFHGVFSVVQSKVLKDKHLKLVLSPQNSTLLVDAIAFNSEWVNTALPTKIRLVYRPEVNEFRGRRTLQLNVSYIEAAL